MSKRIPTFGTDGVRGVANSELTVELSVALGRSVAKHLGSYEIVLVGSDTRLSSPLLQAAFAAGVASLGMDVVNLGVLPTPAIATHSALAKLPAAVISASHNPYSDNGIKLFGPDGRKLPDATETLIGSDLSALLAGTVEPSLVSGAEVGSVTDHPAPFDVYISRLVDEGPFIDLGGIKVVLDCANGAASAVAPLVLERLGANVIVINNAPDGKNINDRCGSTHPEALQQRVVAEQAVAGLALDGDADRVIAVDERGQIVDGDHLIAMLALDAKSRHELNNDTVVVTVMTNLGFRLAMREAGISVYETKVGDRYVAQALTENNWSLGGEQSGHVIFPALATTGDGLLSGLFLLDLLVRSKRTLSDLATSSMQRLPQVLKNVTIARRGLEDDPSVVKAVEAESARLGDSGRVLLRPSGTEPLMRVMVEASTAETAETVCERLCAVVVAADKSIP